VSEPSASEVLDSILQAFQRLGACVDAMTRATAGRQSSKTARTRVDAGVKELNEMTIGRTDDPENPFGAKAFKAAFMFGLGSRTPSGPAAVLPRRTHDRNRSARQNSHFFSCIRGAVHTCNKATLMGHPLG